MQAWDTETGLIQGGLLAPPLACLTFSEDGMGAEIIHWKDPACKRELVRLLEEPMVGANLAYDLAVVGNQFRDLVELIFEALSDSRCHDVLIRQKLLDIGDGNYRFMVDKEASEIAGEEVRRSVRYGLADLTKRLLKVDLPKDKYRLDYGKLRYQSLDAWPSGAIEYAKNDAAYTYQVFQAQNTYPARIEPARYLINEADQVRASFALQLISCWGFAIDSVTVRNFRDQLEEEQNERFEFLKRGGLVRLDGSRNQQVAVSRMLEKQRDRCALTPKGLEKYRAWWGDMHKRNKLTPENRVIKKRELLHQGYVSLKGENCKASGDALLIAYGEYGQFQTLFTKVGKLLASPYLPVQTSFEILLETGRTSSSSSKLIPNSLAIQNLPRKEGMRECFLAREGHVLIACDYVVAELVSLAQITYAMFGQSRLREVLNQGHDPHLMMAARLCGLPYEKLRKELKNKKYTVDLMGMQFSVKKLRQLCKALSFGLPGGLGAETFIEYTRVGYGVSVPLEHFADLKSNYLVQWPEMSAYFRAISDMCDNPEGRCDISQFMSKRLRGRIPYTVACNTGFQGLTADGAKAALYEVVRRCYAVPESALYGARVVNFVHDEILLEVLRARAQAAAQELQQVMCEQYQAYTPDVLITAEPSMMIHWSKDASDPVFDARGFLIPYEEYRAAV